MTNSNTSLLVATLIAGSGSNISASMLETLSRQSDATETQWLAENEAADIIGTNLNADALRKAANDEQFDVIIQPLANRRKKFLAADMESTIIEQEMLDELANDIGMGEQVAHITRRAMNGELDFKAALRARVALFDGKPISLLENAAKRITLMPGAETLVATMKANGATCWLITGGFTYFGHPVAKQLGFDQCHGNELVIKGNEIVGEVTEPLLDRNRKKELFETAVKQLNITAADGLAVGDGANDVPMLNTCNEANGLGIAYQAKPKVRAAVPQQVNYGDLTALLYAQGYKKSDFKTA